MGARDRRFKVVECEGHSERDLFDAEELEELAEITAEKAGLDLPEVRL